MTSSTGAGALGAAPVLVTGSTRRIGRAIALDLAARGVPVVVNGRDESAGTAVVREIASLGGDATFVAGSVMRPEPARDVVERAVEWKGSLGGAVLSGAASSSPPIALFEETDPERHVQYAVAHWLSKAYCLHALVPLLRGTGGGSVVVISTDAGRVPTVGEAMIGGAAAGLQMMVKTLAREAGRGGVRINTLCVSATETVDAPDFVMTETTAGLTERLRSRQVLGAVSADDLVGLVAFLLSPAAARMTGQVVSINGGLSSLG